MFEWLKGTGKFAAEILRDTSTATAGSIIAQMEEKRKKMVVSRPYIRRMIRNLENPTAKDNLMRRYREEVRKTKCGEGNEDRWTYLLVEALEGIPEEERLNELTQIGLLTDEKFELYLDFIEHNPKIQFVQRHWTKIKGILKEEGEELKKLTEDSRAKREAFRQRHGLGRR